MPIAPRTLELPLDGGLPQREARATEELADTYTTSALKPHDSTIDRANVDGVDAEKTFRRDIESTLPIMRNKGHLITGRARRFLKERWSIAILEPLDFDGGAASISETE